MRPRGGVLCAVAVSLRIEKERSSSANNSALTQQTMSFTETFECMLQEVSAAQISSNGLFLINTMVENVVNVSRVTYHSSVNRDSQDTLPPRAPPASPRLIQPRWLCEVHLGLCFSLCRLHLFGRVDVQLCIVVREGSSCVDL